MVIFNSYVKLPEGTPPAFLPWFRGCAGSYAWQRSWGSLFIHPPLAQGIVCVLDLDVLGNLEGYDFSPGRMNETSILSSGLGSFARNSAPVKRQPGSIQMRRTQTFSSEWSGCLFFRLHVGNAGTRYYIDSLCGCYPDNVMNSMKGASEKSLRPVRSQDARTKLWQRPVSRAEPSIFIVRDLDGDSPNIVSHKKIATSWHTNKTKNIKNKYSQIFNDTHNSFGVDLCLMLLTWGLGNVGKKYVFCRSSVHVQDGPWQPPPICCQRANPILVDGSFQ